MDREEMPFNRVRKNICAAGITTHNPRLHKGLVPIDKAERVKHYVENLVREVGIIAHACGVDDPRQLRRILLNRHLTWAAEAAPTALFLRGSV